MSRQHGYSNKVVAAALPAAPILVASRCGRPPAQLVSKMAPACKLLATLAQCLAVLSPGRRNSLAGFPGDFSLEKQRTHLLPKSIAETVSKLSFACKDSHRNDESEIRTPKHINLINKSRTGRRAGREHLRICFIASSSLRAMRVSCMFSSWLVEERVPSN
jgi:hypothetical protein